jgi:transcriptional regulator with PAS, ATPase and Fis domain
MSLGLQAKILRVLQEKQVRRVGGHQAIPVDVRLVAATNRDLDALVAEKALRRDLYYRLRVVPLHVPPLRDRREDLLPLARAFIARACHDNHCGPCSLSSEVLDLLHAYDWPGNVRELEHAIERAVILAENHPTIRPEDLPPEIREGTGRHQDEQEPPIRTLADVERRHILETLDRLGGNKKETARVLGVAENTLHRKLKSFRLPRLRAPKRRR